jgi:hypothetical protein
MHYVSVLSTIIAFAFTAAVVERYRRRGGLHLLFWAIGLFLYGLGTLSEVILIFTFNTPILKLWYLSGAMLTAAWLGQGTVYLLVRKPGWARTLAVVLIALTAAAIALIALAPVNQAAAAAYNLNQPVSGQYKDILIRGTSMIILTILLNTYGAVALIGGAIYSAFLFWRKRVLADRMYGNILIAAGALMPTLGGAFIRAGLADWLYLSEFLGIILMYAGFIKATAYRPLEDSTGTATVSAS